MTTLNKKQSIHLVLALGLLTTLAALAQPAAAQCDYSEARGLYLGLGVGVGGGQIQYRDSSRSIFEDPQSGAMGNLRFGYAFNGKLAAGLDLMGFGRDENGADDELGWGLGAALATVTWHPGGHGFFVRGGLGVGGGEYVHPDTGRKIEIRDRVAGSFSLGYDWRLSEHTMLGLVAEGMSLDAGGSSGYEEDEVGSGGVSLQFTWLL